jgi:hypothetical protein
LQNFGIFYIGNKLSSFNWIDTYIKLLESEILNFSLALSKKWLKSGRNINRFNKLHTEWLVGKFKLSSQGLLNLSTGGRTPKQPIDSTDKSKLMKIIFLMVF